MSERRPVVAFFTLGCKVNQSDSGGMEQLFKQAGYDQVSFDRIADVYVINTCIVTDVARRKSRRVIRGAIRRNPQALVVVVGCYPQTAADEVKKIEGVGLVIGGGQRGEIVRLVEQARQSHRTNETEISAWPDTFEELPPGNLKNRTRAYLKIQDGCNQYCSYCIIPYARGASRSRPLDSVRMEAVRLTGAGFKEIVLIGIHLGAYGLDQDTGAKLSDAVRAVLSADGLERLRLGSLESPEADDDLLDIMADDRRLCRHLHLPLQSGCDEILLAMRRPYRTADFARQIENIRVRIPDISITTDIIAGFPGETQEMFARTCAFVENMAFSNTHIFPFSPRRGTLAANLPEQVSRAETARRVKLLESIDRNARGKFLAGLTGQTRTVLFEQAVGDLMRGLTDDYARVYSPLDRTLLGKISRVRIIGGYGEDALSGEIYP